MTNVLTPNAKQQFFDNNGKPLVGGKLFTYAAGTTTKLATTVSPSGANNTNPIILDYRGEANVWIPPNVAYKFVLAPSTDTDPPTHAIWTVDNLVSSQLVTLYGGVDTGVANAYALNFTSNFTTLTDGIIVYWIPSHTNTGASTLNVNLIGAVPVVNYDGTPVTSGTLAANNMVGVIYRAGSWYLLTPSIVNGSFLGTLTGMTTTVTGTINYRIVNKVVTLFLPNNSNIQGTSNTVAMSLTGIPSEIGTPAAIRDVFCHVIDNGVKRFATAQVDSSIGQLIFLPEAVSGATVVPSAFTAAGTKGLPFGWTVSYPL